MNKYMDRNRSLGEFVHGEDDDIIICRCEEITKGEIRRAVHEGMMTMTEVKRYLRAGMGLCQGNTCGKLIKGIIARELEISASQIEECTARGPARPVEINVLGNEVESNE